MGTAQHERANAATSVTRSVTRSLPQPRSFALSLSLFPGRTGGESRLILLLRTRQNPAFECNSRFSLTKLVRSAHCSGIHQLMDFGDDVGVKGELVGNSLDAEGRTYDENDMGGSSVEGDQILDYKVLDEECAGKEISMVPETSDEPYVGQEFESEADAHAFYNAYATRVGFVIRVSKLSRSRRDGTAIGRALVCNKEGFRMPDKREKVVRQRVETRVGCRAMILVRKLNSGKWTITKCVKEHTHQLTPGKGRKDFVYDQYPQNEHDKIRELSQQLAIEKRRSATYKRHLEMIFEHIEEQNLNLSKRIQDIVHSVREVEANEKQNLK